MFLTVFLILIKNSNIFKMFFQLLHKNFQQHNLYVDIGYPKKISPIKRHSLFANTTLAHLQCSITLYNAKSYNTLIFTIKNCAMNKLPYEKN